MKEVVEGHKINIGGIKHQLNGHQNSQGIAPRKSAVNPDAENNRGEHEKMMQRQGHPPSPPQRLRRIDPP
jgi:hypothetical protein